MDVGSLNYLLLFFAALGAGFIDAIAGGGGLITIPALIAAKLPPKAVLGTNKLQSSFGSGSATVHFWRAHLLRLQENRTGVLCTAAGAVCGAALIHQLSSSFLARLIPWLLVAIALYLVVQPRLGEGVVSSRRLRPTLFFILFGLVLGFYDGFFGPGTGSFWAIAFVLGLGLDLTRATAKTKLMNFTSNVASLAVFITGGVVHVRAGLLMGVAQCIGAQLGAAMVVRKGTRFIRPFFIAVALAIALRLLWQQY